MTDRVMTHRLNRFVPFKTSFDLCCQGLVNFCDVSTEHGQSLLILLSPLLACYFGEKHHMDLPMRSETGPTNGKTLGTYPGADFHLRIEG